MRITLADIAKKVGKSQQLVSAVLNGGKSSSVASEATRRKILAIADDMGYHPNAAAKTVATGKFNGVGLLLSVETWKSSLPTGVLEGIRAALTQCEMHLSLGWFSDRKLTKHDELPRIIRGLMADGLLIKYDSTIPRAMIEIVDESPIPAVWLNTKRDHDAVYPDDFSAGRMAAEHLIKLGHRRIAYIDTNPRPQQDHYSSAERLAGYAQAIRKAGLKPLDLGMRKRLSAADAAKLVLRSVKEDDPITALVAYSDHAAWPVAYAAAREGVRVPRDLSIVSFGGSALSDFGITLTTVTLPEAEVGRLGVEMLLSKIRRPGRALKSRALPFALVAGDTTAPRTS